MYFFVKIKESFLYSKTARFFLVAFIISAAIVNGCAADQPIQKFASLSLTSRTTPRNNKSILLEVTIEDTDPVLQSGVGLANIVEVNNIILHNC